MVKIFRVRTFLSSVIPALEGLPAGRQGSVNYTRSTRRTDGYSFELAFNSMNDCFAVPIVRMTK